MAAAASALRECMISITYAATVPSTRFIFIVGWLSRQVMNAAQRSLRTPRPLTNKQIRLSTRPTVPSTYCVNTPDSSTESGASTSAPTIVLRNLSSGTHPPPRRARRFATILSEMNPPSGLPTEDDRMGKIRVIWHREDLLMQPRPAGMKQAPMTASLVMLYFIPYRQDVGHG